MLRTIVSILYFTLMLFLVATLITDSGYSYLDALFISSTYLPTVAIIHLLSRDVKLKNRAQIIGAISALAAIFILQILLISLANFALSRLSYEITMPKIVVNPVLVLVILLLYYLPYRVLINKIFKKVAGEEELRRVEFISNRKRTTLLVKDILYIESCDTEVWLHTVGGESYRSRTNISSWQRELGENFLRIHRSYLINRSEVDSMTKDEVTLNGGAKLPISRSYQQRAANENL